MNKFSTFLESFVANVENDLSHRFELNCFLIFGFQVAQYLLLKQLHINLLWAAVFPTLCFVLYSLNGVLKNVQEAKESGQSDPLSMGFTVAAVVLSSALACVYICWLASNPVEMLEALLKGLPLSPIILFYVATIPLRRWLGKWGVIASYVMAFILVIIEDPRSLGISY